MSTLPSHATGWSELFRAGGSVWMTEASKKFSAKPFIYYAEKVWGLKKQTSTEQGYWQASAGYQSTSTRISDRSSTG